MNKAIEAFLQGYTGGANTLQPSVSIIESGETLAIPKHELKEMDDEAIKAAMFNMFDNLVEHYNIYPDALESEVMIFGFSTLQAHHLVQKWMEEREI